MDLFLYIYEREKSRTFLSILISSGFRRPGLSRCAPSSDNPCDGRLGGRKGKWLLTIFFKILLGGRRSLHHFYKLFREEKGENTFFFFFVSP